MQATSTPPSPFTLIITNALPRLMAIVAVCMIFGAKALENEQRMAAAPALENSISASTLALVPVGAETAVGLN